MNTNIFDFAIRLLDEVAAPVFWGPTLAPLKDASEIVTDDSELVTMALELERPVIDAMILVAVRLDVLESAVLVASTEPSLEPRDGGKRSPEVIAGTGADTTAVVVTGEPVSEPAAPVTEPAVISTR